MEDYTGSLGNSLPFMLLEPVSKDHLVCLETLDWAFSESPSFSHFPTSRPNADTGPDQLLPPPEELT